MQVNEYVGQPHLAYFRIQHMFKVDKIKVRLVSCFVLREACDEGRVSKKRELLLLVSLSSLLIEYSMLALIRVSCAPLTSRVTFD